MSAVSALIKEVEVGKANDIAVLLCDKYYSGRRKHTADKWLTFRALKERCFYKPSKEPKEFFPIMTDGFAMDQHFCEWLNNGLRDGKFTKNDLKDCIILLRNHKSRILWRDEFLPIAGGTTALMLTTTSIFGLAAAVPLIAAIFTLLVFSERTMLNDLKSATDELLNIVEAVVTESNS